jgi:hypothetical protein
MVPTNIVDFGEFAEELGRILDRGENQSGLLDMLVIDGAEIDTPSVVNGNLVHDLCNARVIVFDNIHYACSSFNTKLLGKSDVLMDHNLCLRGGYAIFKRRDGVDLKKDRDPLFSCPQPEDCTSSTQF